ncbi:hypothetical protein O1W17_35745, partial [Streptomyces sp. H34-S5]|nr:hypothetical protein [Streptomyces sp. H34-S5]
MSTSQRFGSTAVEQAEAVLVEQYPQLVRLAYLTLPECLPRHTRVLLAHKAVQHALPRGSGAPGPGPGAAEGPGGPGEPSGPGGSGEPGGSGPRGPLGGPDSPGGPLSEIRVRVLRAALAPAGRVRSALAKAGWPPVPPFVWGLRLWPPAGGIDEAAGVLAGAPGPVRAAFVLHRMDGLPEEAAVRLLGAAGADDPSDAVREALALPVGAPLPAIPLTPEFDASVVSARPTDRLRRRRRGRAGGAAAREGARVTGG